MSKVIAVTNFEDLGNIDAILHDFWLSVDAVEFNREKKILSIPFAKNSRSFEKTGEKSEVGAELVLVIRAVTDVSIEDTQGITFYDYNVMKFEKGRLVVMTGIPCELSVAVEAADVTVEKVGHFDGKY